MAIDPRTPVLVGAGAITQRITDPSDGTDAIGLMAEASRRAVDDAGPGGAGVLAAVRRIVVPQGTWFHADPARLLAGELALADPDGIATVLAEIGILQQDVIADACTTIATGSVDAVLVVGGEAKHRALLATIAGTELPTRTEPAGTAPTHTWAADSLGVHDIEILRHAVDPPTSYALIDRAIGHDLGRDPGDHRARLGERWSRFASIAATRPDAWDRSAPDAGTIIDPAAAGNRAIATPYTKLLCSQWNVDMGAALLLCSAGTATALGIDRDRWVFPHSSAVSNHAVPVVARADIGACPAASLAARAALDHARLHLDDTAAVDLYSCFPAAVHVLAHALGLDPDGARALTVTGGMTFFGGPLNSYVLHALAAMVPVLRADPASSGLSTSVSGFLVKQGFGVWAARPPATPFAAIDVSAAAATATPTHPVDPDHTGEASVRSSTVVHGRDGSRRTVVVADADGGARTIATTTDPDAASRFTDDPGIGATVRIAGAGELLT